MIKKLLTVLLLISSIFITINAQTNTDKKTQYSNISAETAEKIDALFAEYNKPNSPGCAVGVLQGGDLIFKKGYGAANLEYNVPITPETVFHVASDSKQFTAFAILLLARQGKLSLNDDIRKYLPELNDFGEKVTIRHLIYHTGGIRDQWQLLRLAGIRGDDVITNEHILKILRRQKELNFKPGEKELYSNSGYTLLAEIVSRVSGKSFSEFMKENVFQPLGMTNTHFHEDHNHIVKNRAYSYSSNDTGYFEKATLSFANVGATNLMTSVEDLAKWIRNFENPKVGDRDLVKQMYQSGALNSGEKISYAFGLMNGEYKGLKTVGHGGGDAGFRSYYVHFPQQKFAAITLCNVNSVNIGALWNISGAAYKIADLFLADKYKPEEKKPAEDSTPNVGSKILNTYVGSYRPPSGEIVNLTNYYGTLMMWNPPGAVRMELESVSQTEFTVKGKNERVLIEKDSAGNVSQIVIKRENQSKTAKRLPPRTFQELAEYTGRYYSEELDTSYKITIENGRLVAHHWRNEDIPLKQLTEDLFEANKWYFDEVHFLRDKEKKINSFRVSAGRVKNLLFEKK
jgi:CubicO group peptidase (beta-lactamase class C family)